MYWFGAPWSRQCVKKDQIMVPIGRECEWCDEEFQCSDSGVAVPVIDTANMILAGVQAYTLYHAECLYRQFTGSVGHQMRICECNGNGDEDLSELGLSRREAALRAWAFFWEDVHRKARVH